MGGNTGGEDGRPSPASGPTASAVGPTSSGWPRTSTSASRKCSCTTSTASGSGSSTRSANACWRTPIKLGVARALSATPFALRPRSPGGRDGRRAVSVAPAALRRSVGRDGGARRLAGIRDRTADPCARSRPSGACRSRAFPAAGGWSVGVLAVRGGADSTADSSAHARSAIPVGVARTAIPDGTARSAGRARVRRSGVGGTRGAGSSPRGRRREVGRARRTRCGSPARGRPSLGAGTVCVRGFPIGAGRFVPCVSPLRLPAGVPYG